MRHPKRHLGIVSADTIRWMERQQRQAEELGQTPRWPWPLPREERREGKAS